MFYQFSFNVKYTWLEVQKEIVPIWGRHSFKKKKFSMYRQKRIIFRDLELPGQKGEVMAGRDTAGPGLFYFARLALKTCAPGLILRCTCLQSCCWRSGGGFVFGQGGNAPFRRAGPAVGAAPLPVKSSSCLIAGKGLFLLACLGKALIVQPLLRAGRGNWEQPGWKPARLS